MIKKFLAIDESQSTTPWISVEDRLPPSTGYFLILGNMYDEKKISMGYVDYEGVIRDKIYEDHLRATHWMPLPQLP